MAAEYSAKCELCGKHYMKANLGVFGLSKTIRSRNNYCSKKCFNEDNNDGPSATTINQNNNKAEKIKLEALELNEQMEEKREKREKNNRINTKVNEISKLKYGNDSEDILELLNELATYGSSKPSYKERKVIFEKMEFGIIKLKKLKMDEEANLFEKKLNKIKPNFFNKIASYIQ